MSTMLNRVTNYLLDNAGVPSTVSQAIKSNPHLLAQPEPTKFSIDANSIPRWHEFGEDHRCRSAVNGWSADGGFYEGRRLDLPALRHIGYEARQNYWVCEIQDVAGLSASKSKLSTFTSLDEMAKTNSPEMVEPVTKEKLEQNLAHREIRILRDNSPDFFVQYLWDKRVFLVNAGGSHHFAAARYIAGCLDIPVPLSGVLVQRGIKKDVTSTLCQDFDMFLISSEPMAFGAFHDGMRKVAASYYLLSLPAGFCSDARAILLPKDEKRSVNVAKVMREAGAFDLGLYLIELAGQQEPLLHIDKPRY